jgi:1-acyl-sn-glycerol-3-phosphate acyltransferase
VEPLGIRLAHEFVWRGAPLLYFNRIAVLGAERLPRSGPTLYLALHRNGAVDGFVYHRAVPRALFMISAQLRRSVLGRLFFAGIEVVRDKDREGTPEERARNQAALENCFAYLDAGGELAVLPEGTSDLGPKHLPFRRGAARIAQAFLARGGNLTVIPLGVHYERAWAFRSNVEIVVGTPIDTALPDVDEAERVRILHDRFTQALESVGVNVETAAEQARIESLAYAATLGTGHAYFDALKRFERGVPAPIAEAWAELERKCDALGLMRHQGVPLVPIAHAWLYVAALVPLGFIVLCAMLINLPPLAAAAWAGARFSDAPNVIALWRLLVGFPLLCLWVAALAVAAWMNAEPALFATYAAVSVLGTALFYRTKKVMISVYNLVRGRALRGDLVALHARLDEAMTHAS